MFQKKICCVICGEKLSDNRIDELYKPAIDMGYRELIVPMCKECADELMARATDVFIDGEELILGERGEQEKEQAKKMDGERAIKELRNIPYTSASPCPQEVEKDRIDAIAYAIESIRFRMAKESEERGEYNG